MYSIVAILDGSFYDTLITQYPCLQKALRCPKTQDLDLDTKIGLNTKLDWIQNLDWKYKIWLEMPDLGHLELLMDTSSLSEARNALWDNHKINLEL